MTELTESHRKIYLHCLLMLSFLLLCFFGTAQETSNSKQIVKSIQNLSGRDNLPDARDIVLKMMEQYDKNSYNKNPFYYYNLYRKTSVDVVVHKDSIEAQIFRLRNSSDIISQYLIRPFDFCYEYARPNGESDETNVTILLFEDYKSVYADNLNKKKGEITHASRKDGIFETIGHKNISSFLDEVFGDINLFQKTSNIMLLAFKVPLNKENIDIYSYKLLGQKVIDGNRCNQIAFYCENIKENAFAGNIYVTVGENPKLVEAQFTFNNRNSAIFLKDILLTHSFGTKESSIIPTKTESILLLGDEKKRMMAVKRTDMFLNYTFDMPPHPLAWKTGHDKDYFRVDPSYWTTVRPIPLTDAQMQIKHLELAADSSSRFKRLEREISFAMYGSYSLGKVNGKVELAPLTHFISYNDMEGLRLRIGGNSTIKFSDRLQLGGYLAYGTKDTKFKYQTNLIYSLSPKQKFLWEYPKNLISFTYASDLNIPGQDLLVMNRDHFAQSFSHTPTNNMSLQRIGLLTYESENSHNVSYKIGGKITYDKPIGIVTYMAAPTPADTIAVDHIVSSDLIFSVRFAPGERFIQRQEKRTAIRRASFEVNASYRKGIKGLFGADYGYDVVNFDLFKRFDLARNLAQIDTYVAGGKMWGSVPFPLLFIPEGNQSYVFNSKAYNTMNFYEFATDKFVSASIKATINWSPIRLFNKNNKIKMCLGSKMIYGPLSEQNDPTYHPDLFIFNNGIKPLGNTPYTEVNIGLANIFSVLRIDYARRLTYTSSDNVSGNPITNGTILLSGSFAF